MFEDIVNFFKGKRSEHSKSQKRSPFIITACIIAIIIPTLFAVFYAYLYDDDESIHASSITAELFDSEGTLMASAEALESDILHSDLASTLYKLISTKQVIEAMPESFNSEPNFRIAFTKDGSVESYLCYFTDLASESYIKDKSGKFFVVEEDSYRAFLNSDFSEAVYPQSAPPMFLTGDGESILPNSAEWTYRKQNGEFANTQKYILTEDELTYRIGGAINLSFDVLPDECTAKIQNEQGEVIFEGGLNELTYVTVKTGEKINAEISASWQQKEQVDFYGNTSYKFGIIVENQAEFSIDKTDILAGQFAIISVKNIGTLSKIIYKSEATETATDLSLITFNEEQVNEAEARKRLYAYTPMFAQDGSYARAIIPIPRDLPTSSFSFSVSYGASKQSFSLNIFARSETSAYNHQKHTDELISVDFKALLPSLQAAIDSVKEYPTQMVFFRESFATPEEFGFVRGYTYSTNVFSADGITELFNSLGDEYLSSSSGGQAVKALNIGVVVAVGQNDYIGKYAVVEHGMGLRTWYCGLSSVNAKVGDILSKGDTLGKSGDCNLLSRDGVFLMCTVYGTIINPDAILGKELILYPEKNQPEN